MEQVYDGLSTHQVKLYKINSLRFCRVQRIPPIEVQNQAVEKVDELMALCDAMKAQFRTAQTTQLQLADVLAEQAVMV